MPFSIVLSEDDLRSMDIQLREGLLKWYFGTAKSQQGSHFGVATRDGRVPLATTNGPNEGLHSEEVVKEMNSNRRVTFPEFLAEGLIQPGDEIWCRALKRDRRHGADDFVRGAEVTAEGSVEFKGRTFFNPSKLALAMANSNQGSRPALALNGYDYLFVKSGRGLVSLNEKRAELMTRLTSISGNGSNGELLLRAESLARSVSTPEKPVTAQMILSAAKRYAAALSGPDKPFNMNEALAVLEEQRRKKS